MLMKKAKLNKTYSGQRTKKRRRISKWQTKVIILCVISTVTAWNFVTLANMYIEAYTPRIANAEVREEVIEPSIKQYIFNEVEQALGFDEAVKAMLIIGCESGFQPDVIAIEPNNTISLGVWQINTIHNNTISNADKLDYKLATEWAIAKRIRDGNFNAWTCNR